MICSAYPPRSLYTFDNWARQLLDFMDEVVGEPAFLITNSVGGACLMPCLLACLRSRQRSRQLTYLYDTQSTASPIKRGPILATQHASCADVRECACFLQLLILHAALGQGSNMACL